MKNQNVPNRDAADQEEVVADYRQRKFRRHGRFRVEIGEANRRGAVKSKRHLDVDARVRKSALHFLRVEEPVFCISNVVNAF